MILFETQLIIIYLDDILVNEDVASAETVRRPLKKFDLESKSQENLNEGVRVLGIWESPSFCEWRFD